MPEEIPLMWTSKGNVPIDSLRYEEQWVLEGEVFALKRAYFDKKTGELVSNSFHGFGLPKPVLEVMTAYASRNDVTVGLQGAGIGGQQAAMA